MQGLMLHCGAAAVEKDQLLQVETPEPRDGWVPIDHYDLVSQVQHALVDQGYQLKSQTHALWRDGNRYFGMFELSNGEDYSTVVGLRNSHDMSFAAGLVMGSNVFVCDNLAFSGEIRISRKHTTHIKRDLPQLVNVAVGRLGAAHMAQEARIAAYKDAELSNLQADHLIIEMIESQIIVPTKVKGVIEEWRRPRHPEHVQAGKTAWRLFNAATENLKGNLQQLPRRTMALHGLLDTAVGIVPQDPVTIEGEFEVEEAA
jgi:hypothetical protein